MAATGRRSSALRHAKRWPCSAPRMPHGEHSHFFGERDVVDVIPSVLEQNPAHIRDVRLPIRAADVRSVADPIERRSQFSQEEIWCGRAIGTPPIVNHADLRVRLRCGPDRQTYRRWRSSSRIAEAGRRRPASADCQDEDRASCNARRSSSVRSSPSSSATRSTTVPSGKAVGSSRTSRPFSTRARRGPMQLLYGFR